MERVIRQIKHLAGKIDRKINLMEVCGTHTVAIFRHGIRSVLPDNIRLLSGPGCPVCVTSVADIEKALELSRIDDVILATFGDMMRVPGRKKSLYDARAEGADIRIVYSPMDSLSICRENRTKRVVFFATGFETTSPSVAATISMADDEGLDNLYIHSVHKLVPPALHALVGMEDIKIDGFILPGHVSTIIGSKPYGFLVEKYNIASVVTGFGAEDILYAILMLLKQIISSSREVQVQYRGVVREEGNPKALGMMRKYFDVADAYWRGIGTIPESGLVLKEEYSGRDIFKIYDIHSGDINEPQACRCGDVLTGRIIPSECNLFGKACTPERPVGACMVSTEGSCAAYYKYGSG
ncbi:hydrogenase expression/formation protein HypD [bacterium BMS3Abin07]|nr:hydrogenase expression/formation protein HypD [bacterium BMS3Abin07]GBE32305.1 hydrogenase expression/formation protein HypD [bacterium BMS3Bbin05]HDO23085.1 hydrogenase formation protein HypD [Nitrospirota bacterium]